MLHYGGVLTQYIFDAATERGDWESAFHFRLFFLLRKFLSSSLEPDSCSTFGRRIFTLGRFFDEPRQLWGAAFAWIHEDVMLSVELYLISLKWKRTVAVYWLRSAHGLCTRYVTSHTITMTTCDAQGLDQDRCEHSVGMWWGLPDGDDFEWARESELFFGGNTLLECCLCTEFLHRAEPQ